MPNSSNGETKSSRTRMANGNSRPMYNDDAFNSDLDSPVEEQNGTDIVMRVGKDYQVKVPECHPEIYNSKHEALLVWQPCTQKVSHAKVDEFCRVAKERHKYSEEQALGMLFWHKHDVDKALTDLANFAPFPDEWSTEDRVLFEQAFSYHGKSFHRIREMLPDKSIAALVKYYYSWKKARTKTSLMDRNAKHAPTSDVLSDFSSEPGSDNENEAKSAGTSGPTCENCSSVSNTVKPTTHGQLCTVCAHYLQKTGTMRPFSLFKRSDKDKDSSLMPQRINPTKNRKHPPKGIYMDEEDLKMMASGGEEQSQSVLDSMKRELVTLRAQVQTNKQHISLLKGDVLESISEYKPGEIQCRPTSRWSEDELLLAVQGVRHYGKDFQAIAQLLGSKNVTQVKSFFSTYRKRYNLDEALAEYESEKKQSHSQKNITIKEDDDGIESDDSDYLVPLVPKVVKKSASPKRNSQLPKQQQQKNSPQTHTSAKHRSSPLVNRTAK